MIGNSIPNFSKVVVTAKIAAFAFKVSKTVSINIRSLPPSINASVASIYVSTSSSKLVLRAPGSLTSGDIDNVRLVGPKTPATHFGFSTVENSSQASLAISAPHLLSS